MNKQCKLNCCMKSTKNSSRGYCKAHYNALLKHGDPLYYEKNKTKKCHDCDEQIPRLKKRCFNCEKVIAIERSRANRKKREGVKKCKHCGEDFLGITEKFCSRKCFFEDSKESRKGKDNPAYRNGDYTGIATGGVNKGNRNTGARQCKAYKENFLLENDYVFCEKCGVSNSMRFEVHHLVYRSEAPKHPNLHHEDNLFLVCIDCHNSLHKKKDTREELEKFAQTKLLFPEIFNL